MVIVNFGAGRERGPGYSVSSPLGVPMRETRQPSALRSARDSRMGKHDHTLQSNKHDYTRLYQVSLSRVQIRKANEFDQTDACCSLRLSSEGEHITFA
jgi:hypothetical protein